MKKVLPFKYPMITSWTWTAATFAVLENYENAFPWLYNNFVQIFCETYDKWVSIHYIPHVDVFSNNPLLRSALIERKIFSSLQTNIIDFIKKCIELDYYVYCKVDERYICKKERFLHELIIYGFDDETAQFKIADFTFASSQKYVFSVTSYTSVQQAYEAVTIEDDDMQDGIGGNGGILIFSVNCEYDYSFNLELLIISLKDYLGRMDGGSNYRTYNLKKESSFSRGLRMVHYGIDVYDEVINYYKKVKNGIDIFYIQPLHVLYDHKVLMIKRLQFLKKEMGVEISESVVENYEKIFQIAKMARNVGIKYWVCKNASLLDRLEKLLIQMKSLDKKTTESLLKELKKYEKN